MITIEDSMTTYEMPSGPNIKPENIKTFPVFEGIASGARVQGFNEKGEGEHLIFIAPIDLEIGDQYVVDISDGYLFRIERNDEIVWSDILHGA